MDAAVFWWLAAGAVVIGELLTGSVYLLMVALGLAAAAIAAHLGFGISAQIAVATVVAAAATSAWHFLHVKKLPTSPATSANRDVNLDVGETVAVDAWNADGTAQVRYRGSSWMASLREGDSRAPGQFRISEVVGNRLVLQAV